MFQIYQLLNKETVIEEHNVLRKYRKAAREVEDDLIEK